MSKNRELSYEQLNNYCNPDEFDFEDTSELESLKDIIGQERAVRAMEFGVKVRMRGYNIYMSGSTGSGKTSYAQNYIKKLADKENVPDDWCYIYDFDKPTQPMAVNLPAGMGKVFQKDMDNFAKTVGELVSKTLGSEEYEKQRLAIIKTYSDKKEELINKLNHEAQKHQFQVKTTSSGIYFLPIVNGKAISVQEYNELDDDLKHEISKASELIQMATTEIIRNIRIVEKQEEEEVTQYESKAVLQTVNTYLNPLFEKYSKFPKIQHFLKKIQEDIIENINEFKPDDEEVEQTQIVVPWLTGKTQPHEERYRVNLLVDNSDLKGAPVIIDFNPTYHNLMGKLEYENEFGSMTTDFTMIKSGLIHRANGGYLILQAKDVLSNAQSWEALKRVLKTKEITIENMREQMGLAVVSTLKPEPIPVDIKVILVGSEYIYNLLYQYDEEFKKLFKIKVDFDEEMDRSKENIMKLAKFISSFCRNEKTMHFHKSGVAKIVDYSSTLVENQTKLSTRFNDIVEILCEATTWAQIDGSDLVMAEHVTKAIKEKKKRCDKYDKKLLAMLKEGTIMIDTDSEVVGQINGLSVIDMGDYVFGKPSRITATTYVGKAGIVNIEREIEMSGTSHSKGVLILSGYIGQKYAQDFPLSLSANLCFEQLYSGVDGDSASSAELYALLSSLAELPIYQGIAVTGSVNQKGEIQPIGGATYKIQGFFELCKARGLNGRQGVIIPHQNVKNLVLDDEVVQAVKEGLFHIYPVKTVDEGIEILTNTKAGQKQKNGKYPVGTVHYRVSKKLEKFARAVAKEDKKA